MPFDGRRDELAQRIDRLQQDRGQRRGQHHRAGAETVEDVLDAVRELGQRGEPSPAALPLMVWAARKIACSVSLSWGWTRAGRSDTSMSRRFSSDSALKICQQLLRDRGNSAPSQASHPGCAVVSLEDQLAPALALDVLGGDRNAFVEENLPRHFDVLPAEMRAGAEAAEGAEHTGAAKELGLQRAAAGSGGDDLANQRAHGGVTKARRLRIAAVRQKKMIDAADSRCGIPEADGDTRTEDGRHAARLARNHHVAGMQVGLLERARRRQPRHSARRMLERRGRRVRSEAHAFAPTMPSEAA